MNAANQAIIDALQASLGLHWTAIEAYSAQATHFERWGYAKLAAHASADATEEREHAARLLTRLEQLDVTPAFEHLAPEFPRHDVPGILAANLVMENAALAAETAGILAAREFGDEITAHLLRENLEGSNSSVAEIEAEQKIIAQIGLQNYLTSKL